MESILLIIGIGLIGGIAVGLQSPMASMITQQLGMFESVFIIHIGGAIIALIPLLVYGGDHDDCRGAIARQHGVGSFRFVGSSCKVDGRDAGLWSGGSPGGSLVDSPIGERKRGLQIRSARCTITQIGLVTRRPL